MADVGNSTLNFKIKYSQLQVLYIIISIRSNVIKKKKKRKRERKTTPHCWNV